MTGAADPCYTAGKGSSWQVQYPMQVPKKSDHPASTGVGLACELTGHSSRYLISTLQRTAILPNHNTPESIAFNVTTIGDFICHHRLVRDSQGQ